MHVVRMNQQHEAGGIVEKWFAVMAKPKQERSVATMLQQAGIATYYPEIKECVTVRGRRRIRLAGLFPGYLFARFEYATQYRTVSFCRGVRRIVMFGNVPAEVEPSLLDEIRTRLDQQDVIHVPSFKSGDVVRISQGPLAGIKAIFDTPLSRKERAVVLLRALYYQSRVVVQLSDIEQYSEAV
jgi:transcriptional antiterminator RfaH